MSRVLPYNAKQWEIPLLLDVRKAVTRRVCKDGNECTVPDMSFYDADKRTYAVHNYADKEHTDKLSLAERTCPICPGDILYVRETWCLRYDGEKYFYKADKNTPREEKKLIDYDYTSWKPSIHMPKEAARIWLKVVNVRVERLQDIKPEDLRKEGMRLTITPNECKSQFNKLGAIYLYEEARENFSKLWNSTIKKSDLDRYGWDANPWVWVIEFERCEKPEPCILAGIEPAEDKNPCIGYGDAWADEPCEMCKGCSKCSGNDMEE